MPTFYDPGADASEASEALRGLAHATRTFENPQDLYGVLSDLLSGVRSLKQVLDQLATAPVENRPRAFDDHGDQVIGSKDALAAAAELHQAATLIGQAEERLDSAAGAASRVAWHEFPGTDAPTAARWISVIFLQGPEADEVLEMIDRDGALAGLNHLKFWDYGDETISAAMENGYVYDVPPSGPLERKVRDDDHHLAYSHSFEQVALYRRLEIAPADQLSDDNERHGAPSTSSQTREQPRRSWFEPVSITAIRQQRGLGL